jgi:hypothetical protein
MWDFDRLAGRATHAQIVHDAGRAADAEPLQNAFSGKCATWTRQHDVIVTIVG